MILIGCSGMEKVTFEFFDGDAAIQSVGKGDFGESVKLRERERREVSGLPFFSIGEEWFEEVRDDFALVVEEGVEMPDNFILPLSPLYTICM